MKIFIASGSNDKIKNEYLELTKNICEMLCKLDTTLVFGTYDKGMMGICYDTFKNNHKDIIGITTLAYHDSNILFKDIKLIERDSSFKRLEEIFKESDMFLFLPGGTGSLSELLGIMEELKTNKVNKKIIIYNYQGFYDEIINYFNLLDKRGFAYHEELNKLIIINNIEDLEREIKNERN